MESALAAAVAGCKPPVVTKKSRRKTQGVVKAAPVTSNGPHSASAVFKFGLEKGWVS